MKPLEGLSGRLLRSAVLLLTALFQLIWVGRIDDARRQFLADEAQKLGGFDWWLDSSTDVAFLFLILAVGPLAWAMLKRDIFSPRIGWIIVAAWAATSWVLGVANAQPQVGGVASRAGVTWFKSGRVLDSQPWSSATQLAAGCQGARRNYREPFVSFKVSFADKDVELGFGAKTPLSDIWIESATMAAQAVRKPSAYSHVGMDPRCLEMVVARASPAQAKAFIRLLRPRPYDVSALRENSPRMSALIGEVVAEGGL